MKYYKLTDTQNYNEIVMNKDGKNYIYRFGVDVWIRSAIMVSYSWPEDSLYGKSFENTSVDYYKLYKHKYLS